MRVFSLPPLPPPRLQILTSTLCCITDHINLLAARPDTERRRNLPKVTQDRFFSRWFSHLGYNALVLLNCACNQKMVSQTQLLCDLDKPHNLSEPHFLGSKPFNTLSVLMDRKCPTQWRVSTHGNLKSKI